MSKNKILVITATLGDRITLKKTVDSVKSISGNRIDHILIAPLSKVESLQLKFPDLKILPEPENYKGIYPALNYGLLKFAKDYEYLTFINDDDFWLKDYQKLIDILDTQNDVDVVYGKVIYFNNEGSPIFKQASSYRYKAFTKLLAHDVVLFTQQATLMRSSVFIKLKGFDDSYKLVGDSDFWIRAIRSNYNFKFVNSFCAGYMIQEWQLTSDRNQSQKEHEILNNRYSINKSIASRFELILYRLLNAPLYATRILFNKKFKTKSHFHSKSAS